MTPPPASTSPRTPIHAQFSTSITGATPSPPAPKPVVVPALTRASPRSPPRSPSASSLSHARAPAFDKLLPMEREPQRLERQSSPTVSATSPVVNARTLSESAPEPALEDGPLFRAHIATLGRRVHSLRHALKKLVKTLEASLVTLRESLDAHLDLDDALGDLGARGGGVTPGDDPLGALYDRTLRTVRARRRCELERDLDRSRELAERLRSSTDRLKLVEDRRKHFEGDSKTYYEDLAKYLAKSELDESKLAALDAKQTERTALFRQQRVDYFSFIEGILASEEHAVAAWLLAWQDVESDDRSVHNGANTSVDGWVHLGDVTDPAEPPKLLDAIHLDSDPERPSGSHSAPISLDDHAIPSRSSTLDVPPAMSPATSSEQLQDHKRKRRTSLPHWGLSPSPSAGAEKPGIATPGRRDRFRGFIKSAQHSLQSALPTSSSSHNLFSPTSATGPGPRTPPLLSDEFFPVSPDATAPCAVHLLPPPSPRRSRSPQSLGSHPRKKEGFLYATEAGQKHSSSGDGGARYNRYWVVLSEGRLVEYDRWTDSLSVHGTPINLRYATARSSKQAGDRRFCFEVLTPQLRRVYQATNDQECSEWQAAICKSVESLLNGTSSVRHFDPAHIEQGSPYANDYASSLSVAIDGRTPSPHDSTPTSPKGRFGPSFLSRHTSLGHVRKMSGSSSKKDKRRSVQHPPPQVPALRVGDDDPSRSNRRSFDPSSRPGREVFTASEGSEVPTRPMLDGLGIPFPPAVPSASRSSPNLVVPRPRTVTSRSDGFSTGDEGDLDETGSILSEQDLAISNAVKRWASREEPTSPTVHDSKFRNATKIVEIADDRELGNGKCADCRASEPKWASWSLGIVLCIRCSGLHRSLGTHISKVRSIELDDWSDEQIAAMVSVGNARSNAFFEAELDPKTLDSLVTDSTIATFVKQKYVEKRWVSLVTPTPPPVTSTTFSTTSR
ncbi:ADP-ribosylation factor GTPase-activating family protein [Sporobolomyces koalae]|uniref:ADP-ribosylation factor GTPase-activating family protein n=1 Tax=Sporobolomyces koalae TaxID=500713 RepID=UPI003175053D